MNYLSLIALGKKHSEMQINSNTFPCTKCSACCRSINNNTLYSALDNGKGICKHLSEQNECTIYKKRPLMCHIDETYEKMYISKMSKLDYYKLNAEACNSLQEHLGINERFRVTIS